MEFFNPFIGNGSGSSGGGTGSSELIRYSIVKLEENNIVSYKLQQNLNGVKSYVGDIIKFDSKDIAYTSSVASNVEEALTYILNAIDGNYNFVTFSELGITTTGKDLQTILSEVNSLNLPVNTIITGNIYPPASTDIDPQLT
jgi:hypothetical protein